MWSITPASSTSVTMTAIDDDGANGTGELADRVELRPNRQSRHQRLLRAIRSPLSDSGMNGRIEKLIFTDKTFTPKNPPPLE